ncbi:BolA family protein [Wenxinia marina]|uniref:Transcriptional regulator, BolA protein family n=1 Tax=Wenxinia marina DSM 24838 TaxID=1123501 RepID=A0A0D0NJR5_9RHOB|nr:BolA family protein [Wenxinia marina]KIQ68570.1 Stress-induced morphogen (activity unknown) [Wenxinia marina DSM 24838]GGL66952.1 BolA family transcriptional regulator [Wenxinia marina]
MGLEAEIRGALESAFSPTELKVENESHRHAGHAGDDGSGESHWRVRMVADAFSPMSRIERHRAVHAALGPAIMGRIHALALDLGAP